MPAMFRMASRPWSRHAQSSLLRRDVRHLHVVHDDVMLERGYDLLGLAAVGFHHQLLTRL